MPLVRFYNYLLDACGFFAGATVIFIAVGIVAEVAYRNIAGRTFTWLLESTEYALCAAVFLAIPWCMREGAHVRMDALLRVVPPRAGRWLEFFADCLGLVVAATMTYYGLVATIESFETNTIVYKSIVFPEWWFMSIFPFSMALLAIEFMRRLVRLNSRAHELKPSGL